MQDQNLSYAVIELNHVRTEIGHLHKIIEALQEEKVPQKFKDLVDGISGIHIKNVQININN